MRSPVCLHFASREFFAPAAAAAAASYKRDRETGCVGTDFSRSTTNANYTIGGTMMEQPSNDKKYMVNDGRHYANPYEDYSPTGDDGTVDTKTNAICDDFKEGLVRKARDLVKQLEENKHAWINRTDCSVYTGTAGIAQMYYHLGTTLAEHRYIKAAEELIEKSLLDAKCDKRVSYLAGNAGPLSLGAVLHYSSKNEEKSMEMVSKLKAAANRALLETSNELLYGKVGYLYALLFVNANISVRPIEAKLIKQMVERILEEGRKYSKVHKLDTPLMYEWHEKEYIGGAHGLAGILYILLQAREYMTEDQLTEDVKPALRYLEKLRFPSGNFPSSLGNRTDKLVHWCHGAPSMTMLFTLAYQVFGEVSFLRVAIDCGEVVWARGLLAKGHGLCHGVSGNAYTFVALYQRTKDARHLYRACKFSEWCTNDKKPADVGTLDRPFSLFEGLAGTIYFLVDLTRPEWAKFPGYTL